MLVTDHKPLMTILGPKKGIPSLAAANLQPKIQYTKQGWPAIIPTDLKPFETIQAHGIDGRR